MGDDGAARQRPVSRLAPTFAPTSTLQPSPPQPSAFAITAPPQSSAFLPVTASSITFTASAAIQAAWRAGFALSFTRARRRWRRWKRQARRAHCVCRQSFI